MAEVMIYRGQKENEQQRQTHGHSTECERGMKRPGPVVAFFSLTLRNLLFTNPSDLMRRFTEAMDQLFVGISPMTVWSPSIAISEQDGHIKVCADLPGLSQDDVRVELTQDELTISGECQQEQDNRYGMYWPERSCRRFRRTIPMPDETHVEQAKATFENEILMVLVPTPSSGPGRSARARGAALEEAQSLN
jgi:HSP20 family molecular chaperone IbpA